MSDAFTRACRDLFKGWSTVSTYKENRTMHVHLTLNEDEFAASPVVDKQKLLDRLFGGTDTAALKRLIVKKKARHGLTSYGRRR